VGNAETMAENVREARDLLCGIRVDGEECLVMHSISPPGDVLHATRERNSMCSTFFFMFGKPERGSSPCTPRSLGA
jgi:hypothetical protein